MPSIRGTLLICWARLSCAWFKTIAQFTRENIEKLLLFLDCHGYLFPEFSLGKPTLLGSGGFSMVYAMERRQDTSQHYALKVTGFQRYATSGAEFRESVRLQRTLLEQCPYVVRILDSRELLLTMEPDGGLLSVRDAGEEEPGEELRLQLVLMDRLDDVIGKSKFGQASLCRSELAHPEEIRRMGVQIGTALMYAHKNNILHRDVKLENIFWDSEDACYKLGDFGAAKYTQDGNAETIIYTEGYGAPEVQHQVLESYNATADIYSLGMTLYLLLNDLRFPGSEGYHVSPVHYDPQFVFPAPEKGTAAFLRVIRKMCSFYPEDRYQSMAQAVAALAEAHNAEEGTAQTIWVDLPTETYRIDPESVSQHRQETRADRILTQKQLKRSAAMDKRRNPVCFAAVGGKAASFSEVHTCNQGSIITRTGHSPKVMNLYNHFIFLMGTVCYGLMLLVGLAYSVNPQSFLYENLGLGELGTLVTYVIETYRIGHIGAVGFAVCLFWLLRESYFRRKYSGEV